MKQTKIAKNKVSENNLELNEDNLKKVTNILNNNDLKDTLEKVDNKLETIEEKSKKNQKKIC